MDLSGIPPLPQAKIVMKKQVATTNDPVRSMKVIVLPMVKLWTLLWPFPEHWRRNFRCNEAGGVSRGPDSCSYLANLFWLHFAEPFWKPEETSGSNCNVHFHCNIPFSESEAARVFIKRREAPVLPLPAETFQNLGHFNLRTLHTLKQLILWTG